MSQSELPTLLPIINEYLQARLLNTLGEDEDRYQYLGKTINSLSDKIQNDYSLLIPFSLVAFQAHPSTTEPEVILVYAVLKEYWKLIDIIYPELPIELIKPIMMETINRLCTHDERIASIVYHANTSAFPHYKYDRIKGSLVEQVLTAAAIKAERFATNDYISSTEIKEKPDFDIEIATPENIKVDRAALQQELMAASGPTDEQGIASKGKNVNPYHINNPQLWMRPFSSIASEIIALSIEGTIDEALSEFANEASTVISDKLKEISVYTNNAGESRLATESKILWWMQSLYSPKLRSSYRDLPLPATIITMAHDLFNLVSVPIPESVVYILGEAILNTIINFAAKDRKAVKLSEWLEKFKQSDVLRAIEPLKIHSSNLENHSQPLIVVVRAVLNGQIASKEMLGDLLNVTLTPRQLGMWLFRDLIAEKLVEETACE
jgi:GTPase-associated system helical domain